MKKSWMERLLGIALIISAYATLGVFVTAHEARDGPPPDFSAAWLFINYAAGLVLVILGSYFLLARKHPPFALWVRIGAIFTYWNMGAMSVASTSIRFSNPPGYMVGFAEFEHWVALVGIVASLYLLLAGERADKPGRQTAQDSRIKWIRLCGAAMMAWPLFHAVLVILAQPWQGEDRGAWNVELFIITMISSGLSIFMGLAYLFEDHDSYLTMAPEGEVVTEKHFATEAGTIPRAVRKVMGSGWYDCAGIVVLTLFVAFGFMSDKDKRMGGEVFGDFDELIAGKTGGERVPWVPAINGPLQKAVVTAYEFVMFPGAVVSYAVLRLFGGGPGILDLSYKGGMTMTVSWAALSWAFWAVFLRRFAYWLGFYDPFRQERKSWGLPVLVRIVEWYAGYKKFGKMSSGNWASLMEVFAHPWKSGDIFLGRPKLLIGGMLRPVGVETEKHMLTIAETGSGKSTAGLIPNLCTYEGSLLCIDPKGELARITWRRRGSGGKGVDGMGQDVHILDPYKLMVITSSTYNPFDEMAAVAADNPDRAVAFAEKIGEAIVKPMGGTNSEYWDKAARTLIRGLVLYIFVHEAPHNKNLLRLRELLMEGDRELYKKAVDDGALDPDKTTGFEHLLIWMKSKRKEEYGQAIAGAAASVLDMGEAQYGGVKTTAQEHTTFLDFPEIRKVCEDSSFRLADLKRKRMSVYVCLPVAAISGAQGRWLRMFIVLFTDIVQASSEEKPDPPVLLAIDEFPNMGRLDGIEIVAPLLRSYGVRFWGISQDLDRLSHVYPDCWSGFVGNSEAVQFMSNKEHKTINFISEKLGQNVVGSKKTGWGNAWLLDEEQVGRFLAKDKKNQIVWYGSRLPMQLKLTPYYEYLPYWYYEADSRYPEKWNRRIWRELLG